MCAAREEEYHGGFPYRSRFRTSALSPGAARSKSVHRRGMLGAWLCEKGLQERAQIWEQSVGFRIKELWSGFSLLVIMEAMEKGK